MSIIVSVAGSIVQNNVHISYGTGYTVYKHSNNNVLYLYVLGATMYAGGLWTTVCGDSSTLLKTAPIDR